MGHALGLGHALGGNAKRIDAAAQGIGEQQVTQVVGEQLAAGVDRHVLGDAGRSGPPFNRRQLLRIESAGLHGNAMDGVSRLAQPDGTIRGIQASGKGQHGYLRHLCLLSSPGCVKRAVELRVSVSASRFKALPDPSVDLGHGAALIAAAADGDEHGVVAGDGPGNNFAHLVIQHHGHRAGRAHRVLTNTRFAPMARRP